MLEVEEKIHVFFELEYCSNEVLNSLAKLTSQNKKSFLCRRVSIFPRTESGKINYNDLTKMHHEIRL